MKIAVGAAAVLLGACAHAPAGVDPRSLAEAESAFAEHSVREGMRAAFLSHFADDGMLLRSGWVNSNAHLAKQPDPPIVLDWRPAYVEVAASGELGLSNGPWRVAVDLGISHSQPTLWDRGLETRAAASPGGPGEPGGLQAAEQSFARQSQDRGARAAYEAHGSQQMRYYRNGADPAIGKDAALAAPGLGDERLIWSADRIETSKSGDFGYARGSYAALSAPAIALGHYLRIWRLEGNAWRVALDVANPLARP